MAAGHPRHSFPVGTVDQSLLPHFAGLPFRRSHRASRRASARHVIGPTGFSRSVKDGGWHFCEMPNGRVYVSLFSPKQRNFSQIVSGYSCDSCASETLAW
jgi:hypothetical protein